MICKFYDVILTKNISLFCIIQLTKALVWMILFTGRSKCGILFFSEKVFKTVKSRFKTLHWAISTWIFCLVVYVEKAILPCFLSFPSVPRHIWAIVTKSAILRSIFYSFANLLNLETLALASQVNNTQLARLRSPSQVEYFRATSKAFLWAKRLISVQDYR